jgi:hemolysin III
MPAAVSAALIARADAIAPAVSPCTQMDDTGVSTSVPSSEVVGLAASDPRDFREVAGLAGSGERDFREVAGLAGSGERDFREVAGVGGGLPSRCCAVSARPGTISSAAKSPACRRRVNATVHAATSFTSISRAVVPTGLIRMPEILSREAAHLLLTSNLRCRSLRGVTAIETATSPCRVEADKPRMRGWLHTYAFFVSVAAAIVLCTLAAIDSGTATIVSSLIYGVTICGLFGVSALYHRRTWTSRGNEVMRRLDHSMIFLFIAGTYTPFCVMLLPPAKATVILSIVWAGAVLGVGMKMITPHAPRWLSTPLYILLGWVAIFVLPDILRAGGVTAFVLMLAGGAFYTIGAVLYAIRKPNPWPKTFGHHEFFHACTLFAAVCHQVAIYFALFR